MTLRLLLLPLAFLLAACGSTPPTKVYTLTPSETRPVTEAEAGAPTIFVDPTAVAEYVDRTQMVTRAGDYRLSLHEFAIWSEPLGELITRSVVDDLSARFGDDQVMQTPIPLYDYPDWRVELAVLRFDVDQGGEAVIDARWTLLDGRDDRLKDSRRELIVTTAANPEDPDSRVIALREGLAILAGRIGDRIAAARP